MVGRQINRTGSRRKMQERQQVNAVLRGGGGRVGRIFRTAATFPALNFRFKIKFDRLALVVHVQGRQGNVRSGRIVRAASSLPHHPAGKVQVGRRRGRSVTSRGHTFGRRGGAFHVFILTAVGIVIRTREAFRFVRTVVTGFVVRGVGMRRKVANFDGSRRRRTEQDRATVPHVGRIDDGTVRAVAVAGTAARGTDQGILRLVLRSSRVGVVRVAFPNVFAGGSVVIFPFGFRNLRLDARRVGRFFGRQGRRGRGGTHRTGTLGAGRVVQHASSRGIAILRRVEARLFRSFFGCVFAIGLRYAGPIQALDRKDHQRARPRIPTPVALAGCLVRRDGVDGIDPAFIYGEKGFGNGSRDGRHLARGMRPRQFFSVIGGGRRGRLDGSFHRRHGSVVRRFVPLLLL